MRITIVLGLTLFGLLILGSCSSVYAKENDIGFSRLDPSSPLYFLKTIRENLEMQLAFTPRVKLLRQLEFATRRLREARTLMTKNADLIPPTMERYSSYLKSLPEKDLEDSEVVIRIKESLAVHLETLYKMYEQVTTIRAKIAIRAAINRIAQRADIPQYARLPACNFLAKEASSSALNDTERVVLAERAQKCFNNLGSGDF
jgi:hypothetical protein